MNRHSYRDRRLRKRNFRSLWICRLNAKARQLGLNYHSFIKEKVHINRKIFSQLVLYDPVIFQNEKI